MADTIDPRDARTCERIRDHTYEAIMVIARAELQAAHDEGPDTIDPRLLQMIHASSVMQLQSLNRGGCDMCEFEQAALLAADLRAVLDSPYVAPLKLPVWIDVLEGIAKRKAGVA